MYSKWFVRNVFTTTSIYIFHLSKSVHRIVNIFFLKYYLFFHLVCSIAPYLNTFSLHFHFKAYIYQKPYTGSFVQIVIFWAKCVWQALQFFYFLEALSFWFCTFCNRSPCRKTEIFQGLLHLNILVVKWIFLRFLIILLQC